MDIIETMREYNLTLKCWPTHKIYYTSYREGRPLEEGERIVEVQLKQLGTNEPVTEKRVRHEKFYEPKWGVKISDWPQWTEHDFYGKTPEEAVAKAIEHIKSKK